MNTYPAELIQHHYACMLVSGLLPSQAPIASPETLKVSLPSAEDQSETKAAATATGGSSSSQASSSRAPTPAQASPQVTKDLTEIFSSRGRSTAWDPSKSQSEVFHTILVDNNVRLPPKKTRPTPRTLNATAAEQQTSLASLQPRSPLSPLHPSSPLFPDGLIAPIWLRKHRELVPSVFVSFYCLTEQIVGTESKSEDGQDNGEKPATTGGGIAERLTGPELKKRDEDLIRVISERKRTLSERGIKFTVVLLTTRSMLESPSLESRLSYIRRSSQLDSKASLFVLTPVSKSELGDFVTSLQSALYESAQDFYREHYRRARKKRSKYPPPASTVSQIMSAATEIRGSPIKDVPLSKEGWIARNDYKLGTFAELMSRDSNDALGHYLNAYQTLANELLASTMLLPPRTKRWAEAKVLSDCINLRICRIHLYRMDGESAWDQFKTHIKRFTELSQGWGIGEMTFEFWSWLGKQYRLMGDLLDLATRDLTDAPLPIFRLPIHFPAMPTFLLHPSHLPTPTANGLFPPSNNPQHGILAPPNEFALNSHCIPAEMCQSAGACYYIAGICAMERWQRFKRMVWEEENDVNKKEEGTWSTLTQERKIDHGAQAIEIFTKAHESFKRHQLQRQSLLVASKIAYAYVEGNQYEMALRFLERILKTFRAEGWPAQTMSLLLITLECAKQSENVESEGRALWSLLSLSCPLSTKQREAASQSLAKWLKVVPTENDKKVIKIESNADDGVFIVESVFSKNQIDLDDQKLLFQIRLTSPKDYLLPENHFDSLHIYFSGQALPFIVNHEKSSDKPQDSSLFEVGTLSLGNFDEDRQVVGKADLRWWSKGTVRAIQGNVNPDKIGLLQVEKVCLQGKGGVEYSLVFHMSKEEESRSAYVQTRWMTQANPPLYISLLHQEDREGVVVRKRSHKVKIDIKHTAEAYLEEAVPILVTIKNDDAVDLQCFIEAMIQGVPQEVTRDRLWSVGKETEVATSRLEEAEVGMVEAQSTLSHIIYLSCQQHLRTRSVEIVVKTVIPGDHTEGRTSEHFETIVIPVKQLFGPSFHANWRFVKETNLSVPASSGTNRRPSITVSDVDETGSVDGINELTLSSQAEGESQGTTAIAAINVGLAVLAKEGIFIEAVNLRLNESSKHLRILGAEMVGPKVERHSVMSTWINGDRWGTVFDVEVLNEAATGFVIEGDDGTLRPTGQLQVEWRREKVEEQESSETAGMNNISLLEVPLLAPPHLLPRIMVSIPSSTTLEQPLVMLLSIVNPSKLSSEVFVSIDDGQSDFGILSHKTFTVPLIAKSTRSVPVHVLSKSVKGLKGQGIRNLPKIRAWQRDRKVKLEEVGEDQHQQQQTTITTPIMNHQRGGGLPLEVQLRYSKSAVTSQQQQQQQNGNHGSLIAQLQAETQKNGGAWTVYVYSQSQVEIGQ